MKSFFQPQNLSLKIFYDSIKIGNIELPDGVMPTITDRDFVVATLVPPTVEVETKPAEEEAEETTDDSKEEKPEDKKEENKADSKKEDSKEESK